MVFAVIKVFAVIEVFAVKNQNKKPRTEKFFKATLGRYR
jgi:hypothetical protein